MIMSTSQTGFNIFKPTLDEDVSKSSEDEEKEIPQIKECDLDKFIDRLRISD